MKNDARVHRLIEVFGDRDYTQSPFHRCCYAFECSKMTFIHIPKTAGTSIHKFLCNKDQFSDRFQNVFDEGLHRPVSRYCHPSEYLYFTVMRHPLDRVWSYFQMVLRWDPRHPYATSARNGLLTFLERCWEVRNMATRYLSGSILDEPTHSAFLMACWNMDCFYAVLDFQRLGESLSSMCESLGYKFKTASVPHFNAARYLRPSAQERELILGANTLDLELYNYWMESRSRCSR